MRVYGLSPGHTGQIISYSRETKSAEKEEFEKRMRDCIIRDIFHKYFICYDEQTENNIREDIQISMLSNFLPSDITHIESGIRTTRTPPFASVARATAYNNQNEVVAIAVVDIMAIGC